MKSKEKRTLLTGSALMVIFIIWTLLIQAVDVRPVGVNGTSVGFAVLNSWFHQFTGVHMKLYVITDWLFGMVGLMQWVKRRKLSKVDFDIILLGVYYVIVIAGYLLFEIIPINYRPVLIEGILEASYPSSTTLLVLSVMPTLTFQIKRKIENDAVKKMLQSFINLFSAFMIAGRLVSGVHWLTDIIGAVLLSAGLFYIYKGIVLIHDRKSIRRERHGIT